tara:strand:+ start:1020 stop:1862 length:843 start_codon:yes stop_codon:yes gene_type:complete
VNEFFWKKAIDQSKIALDCKSLIPINTNLELFLENNINYEIRSLISKWKIDSNNIGPRINPFSPWDKNLEIDFVKSKHILILNKYPIEIGHMLLITKDWLPQNGWLNIKDWQALVEVNSDTTGLWFFNSSHSSGASQPHRHIQLLPRSNSQENCPRDQWLKNRIGSNQSNNDLELNTLVYPITSNDSRGLCEELDYLYTKACNVLGIGDKRINKYPKIPYNLIITNDYFSVILRSKEYYRGFSINALGFAGYLLATETADLQWLKSSSVEYLLSQVIYKH